MRKMNRVVLKSERDFSVRRHHPWIFSGALAEDPAGAGVGETVAVETVAHERLGYGSYSPDSAIRVRMLSFDPDVVPDEALVAERVRQAVARRAGFFAAGATNAVRVVNAENDGLPGVVVDVYDRWAVCQLTSAGAEFWKQPLVEALLASIPGCRGVAERADVDVRGKEGLPVGGFSVLAGEEPPGLVEIFEGSVRFLVDVRNGHKTGFYLDQRDARAAVGRLAKGCEVLNCFSYTGGFGLAAAGGGAAHVVQVDLSREALDLAQKNEELTFGKRDQSVFDYVKADVFQYLRSCRDAGRSFDLVVLDPPKFAASKAQIMKAARGYKDINILAMKLLRPGGVLATFSCSGAMTAELFDKVLAEAASDARHDFQTIGRTQQGADHPVSVAFPDGLYLKGVVLRRMD